MIVFSGQQLVAHWNKGESDYLLVTFDQLNTELVAETHFLLQAQVVPGRISCIGVTTRVRNFYRSSEIERIVAEVEKVRGDRPVIVFGQSAGGYAALKYSGLLRADYVIACSPFFAVRPDELGLTDERQKRILVHMMATHNVVDRPEFEGMAIRQEDTSGRIVALYDPGEMVDAYAIRLIRKAIPQAEILTVPHAGHVIYDGSWSSALLESMVGAIRAEDTGQLTLTLAAMRRRQLPFLIRALTKAANRKPGLFVGAMNAKRITAHPNYSDLIRDAFNLRAINLLAERGDFERAARHLSTMMRGSYGFEIRPARWDAGATPTAMLERHPCLVLSMHGSFLCWSVEHGSARFEPHPFNLTTRLPILARIREGRAVFCTVSEGVETEIRLFPDEPGTPEAPDEIMALDGNCVALRNAGRYMGALPDGGQQILPGVSIQQRMVVLSIEEKSALLQRRQATWFDKVSAAQTPPPDRASVKTVQRSTPRWLKLFGRG
ncbi:hypothetical protein NFI95_09630 [Acetobacteraceae bacterium KSS8]|uniref:Alpha/beta hydrolase n=1 Tax=Endosaccharibacter trunci TaxID=2812733 RepID=A0ABT1W767_9PROT|nr:hypothetical protein [Acetobacteraceae bacterium KSS8]